MAASFQATQEEDERLQSEMLRIRAEMMRFTDDMDTSSRWDFVETQHLTVEFISSGESARKPPVDGEAPDCTWLPVRIVI